MLAADPSASALPAEGRDERGSALQVLSLDGGGLRGMFAAAALAAWEEDFETSVGNHFDLVVGTSTGGLLALGLGFGIAPAEMLSIYLEHGDTIFPPQRRRGMLRGLTGPRYDSAGLRRVLEEQFGDTILGDSRVRLAIPSYDLAADHVHLFRTPHHQDLRRDWRETVIDVALATTAAPTYLAVAPLREHRLIDGGVWANNPTLVGVAECFDRLGGQRDSIRVLSVGTTTEVRHRHDRLDRGGLVVWRRDGLDVVMRGQSLAATSHAQLIVGRDNVFRFNVPTPQGVHSLDDVSPRDLIGRAHAESRTRSPALAGFFDHVPQPYQPHYSKEPADAHA